MSKINIKDSYIHNDSNESLYLDRSSRNYSKTSFDTYSIDSPKRDNKDSSRVKGLVYMFIAQIIYTSLSFAARLSYKHMNIVPFHDTFFKGFIAVIVAAIMAHKKNVTLIDFTHEERVLTILRGTFGASSMAAYAIALNCTSISKVTITYNISPILTAFFTWIILNEMITKIEILGVIVSFFGLILVVRPPFLFSNNNEANKSDPNDLLGVFCSVLSAFLIVGAYITLRKISGKVNFMAITFHWGITAMAVSILLIIFFDTTPTVPVLSQIFSSFTYFILTGIASALYLALVNIAFEYEKAARLTPMIYLTIVFSILLDATVLGVHLQWTDYIGGILIVGFNFSVAMLKYFDKIQ